MERDTKHQVGLTTVPLGFFFFFVFWVSSALHQQTNAANKSSQC